LAFLSETPSSISSSPMRSWKYQFVLGLLERGEVGGRPAASSAQNATRTKTRQNLSSTVDAVN
jgi:hypothetical protein